MEVDLTKFEDLSNDDLLTMLNESIEQKNVYSGFFNEVMKIIVEESELHERISKILGRMMSVQYRLGKQDREQ